MLNIKTYSNYLQAVEVLERILTQVRSIQTIIFGLFVPPTLTQTHIQTPLAY